MVDLDSIDFDSAAGGDHAKEAVAASRPSFEKTQWFPKLPDGGVIYGRFLTDQPDWVTVKQHSQVPTKGRPPGFTGQNWPQYMSGTCRKDKLVKQFFDGKCYVCDEMKQPNGKPYTAPPRTWALMVVREPVMGTQEMVDAGQIPPAKLDKRVGFKDKMREIDEMDKDGKATGKKIVERDVVVVNMGYQNFFASLDGAYYAIGDEREDGNKTVLDRDFVIRRVGTSTDTDYQIMPLPPTPGFDLYNNAELLSKYGEVETSRDGRKVISMKAIRQIIVDRVDDEYYDTFFDRSRPFPPRKGKDQGGDQQQDQQAPAEAPKPSQDVEDPEALAAMMQNVRGYSDGQAPPAPTPEPAGTSGGMMNFG